MTTSDLVAGDLASDGMLSARPGDAWLANRSWNRPSWTIAELEAAKAGRTISVVLPALDEEETIESLGELGSARAVEILGGYLRSPRSMVRRAAARALGRIGDPTAVPALLEGAATKDDTDLRRASLQALRVMEAQEIDSVVSDALLDPHPSVRIAAAEAVSELGIRSAASGLRESLDRFQDEAEAEVAYALGCVGTSDDMPVILREAAECQSMITRRRCLLGVARLLDVEDEAYRLLMSEGMSRDSALLEILRPLTRTNKRVRAALERFSAGDERGALDALKGARPEPAFAVFAGHPVDELFLVAAAYLRKSA